MNYFTPQSFQKVQSCKFKCLKIINFFPSLFHCQRIMSKPSSTRKQFFSSEQLKQKFSRPILRRVILLEKLTRWEVLCSRANSSSEIMQMKQLFPGMFETYMVHTVAINHILHLLKTIHGIKVEHLKAQSCRNIDFQNFDAIIAAGGDGTFLEAASLVSIDRNSLKMPKNGYWIFGINTDPYRSEGKLLMSSRSPDVAHRFSQLQRSTSHDTIADVPPNYFLRHRGKSYKDSLRSKSASFIDQLLIDEEIEDEHNVEVNPVHSRKIVEILASLRATIHRLVHRDYVPLMRRRIRVSIIDTDASCKFQTNLGTKYSAAICTPTSSMQNEKHQAIRVDDTSKVGGMCSKLELIPYKSNTVSENTKENKEFLALNEVLVTSLQSHMSFYVELKIDDQKVTRSKNSGVVVCTGSGSSAWAYNISKVSQLTVETIIKMYVEMQHFSLRNKLVPVDYKEICKLINKHLIFNSEEKKMRLVVREPIENRVFSTPFPSIFGEHMEIRPLTQDALLCVDGINVVPLRFGQKLILSIDSIDDCIMTTQT